LTTDAPSYLTSRLSVCPVSRPVLAETPLQKGDVLIVHSVSGRNVRSGIRPGCPAAGAFVIALTSLQYRKPSSCGARPAVSFETADLVLITVPVGDALAALPGLAQKGFWFHRHGAAISERHDRARAQILLNAPATLRSS
jgi:uncharacterized phosphosugar-binding protein